MRIQQVWVAVLVGACGGGASSPDAAGPDAHVCLSGPDQDGDGYCDDEDLCPTIPNPAQVDLDADGQGWACDDNESLLVSGPLDPPPQVEVMSSTEVFGAVLRLGCAGLRDCENRV